jgi:hypothetical protein
MAKEFSVGTVVEHATYGLGTVSATETDRVTIDFETFGTKKFISSIVKLQASDKVPQPKTRKRAPRKPKVKVPA